MNIVQLLDIPFAHCSGKPAIEFGGNIFTYGELDRRSNQMAVVLQSKGLAAGDRLGIYLENCIAFVDLYLACLKLGVIMVPINILYREREIGHIYSDASPKAIISDSSIPGIATWDVNTLLQEAATRQVTFRPYLSTGDSPAAIIYTSGTTGTSKGAVLSHNNFIANIVNLNACWKITEQDRLLLGLPLFHVHGLANGLNCALAAGATIKLLPKIEHNKLKDEFGAFRPTLFFGVPTVYVRMLQLSKEDAAMMSKSMRLFVSGSAPLPAQVLEDFKQLYGHTILERYGMTETLMNISNPYAGERRAGTVGIPLPGTSIKIVKPDGGLAAPEEEGEIYIKGPNVFSAYWQRPDATATAFEDGYFKTGDMAVVSADGYYTLRGRKSDLIISGGFNIYPREIEEFLLEQSEIDEVAVVGVPDEIKGEVPIAYMVVNKKVDVATLEEKCRNAMASFKMPRKFIVIDSLPRTALGKVQKHLLPKSTR